MHPLLSGIVQNPEALAAGRSVREALNVPNRGFLSKENKELVKHATGLIQIVQDLETNMAPLVAEADAKKNRAINHLVKELKLEQLKVKQEQLKNKELEASLDKYRHNTKQIVTEVVTRKRRLNDMRLDEAEAEILVEKGKTARLMMELEEVKENSVRLHTESLSKQTKIDQLEAATSAPPCIDCPICYSSCDVPYVGTCGHTYCKRCVERSMHRIKIYAHDTVMVQKAKLANKAVKYVKSLGDNRVVFPMPECPQCKNPGAFYRMFCNLGQKEPAVQKAPPAYVIELD